MSKNYDRIVELNALLGMIDAYIWRKGGFIDIKFAESTAEGTAIRNMVGRVEKLYGGLLQFVDQGKLDPTAIIAWKQLQKLSDAGDSRAYDAAAKLALAVRREIKRRKFEIDGAIVSESTGKLASTT